VRIIARVSATNAIARRRDGDVVVAVSTRPTPEVVQIAGEEASIIVRRFHASWADKPPDWVHEASGNRCILCTPSEKQNELHREIGILGNDKPVVRCLQRTWR